MTENMGAAPDPDAIDRARKAWEEACICCISAYTQKCKAANAAYDMEREDHASFEEEHGFSAFSMGALALAYPDYLKDLSGYPMVYFSSKQIASLCTGWSTDPSEYKTASVYEITGNKFDYLHDDGQFFEPYIEALDVYYGDVRRAISGIYDYEGSTLLGKTNIVTVQKILWRYCRKHGLERLDFDRYKHWYLVVRFFLNPKDNEEPIVNVDALRAVCRKLTPEEIFADAAYEASKRAVVQSRQRIDEVLGIDPHTMLPFPMDHEEQEI